MWIEEKRLRIDDCGLRIADFIHKIGVVVKEANETLYWLELIKESLIQNNSVDYLLKECDELLSIFIASGKTAKRSISDC